MHYEEMFEFYGFSKANTNTAEFEEAEKLVFKPIPESNRKELDYSRDGVLENETDYFVPLGWIGCAGHIVRKSDLKVTKFGSYMPAGAHVWAYYQGISLNTLGKDRSNDIRITEVHDKSNTIDVLKKIFDPHYVKTEIAPLLDQPPIVIRNVDLYFGFGVLLETKDKGWFFFEIE